MNKIKTLRSERGLTLREMAKEANVGVATLVRLESGKKANSLTLARVAKVLGIELAELMEFEASQAHKAKKPKPKPAEPTPPPPPPVEPADKAKKKFSFTGQVKENAWAVARDLGFSTVGPVKTFIQNNGLEDMPYEELMKAAAVKFKKEI